MSEACLTQTAADLALPAVVRPSWPIVPRTAVPLRNRLFRSFEPIELRSDRGDVRLRSLGEAPDAGPGWPHGIGFELRVAALPGDGNACLDLPPPLVDLVLANVDPGLRAGAMDEDCLALALEYALVDLLRPLEQALGGGITIVRAWRRPASILAAHTLLFRLALGAGEHTIRVGLDDVIGSALAPLLDRLPATSYASWQDLPIPVSVHMGSAVLPAADLHGLGIGDVIVPEAPPLVANDLSAAIAGRWRAPVRSEGRALVLAAAPSFLPSTSEDVFAMTVQDQGAPDPASLDDLPIKIVFELGRTSLPLADLRDLGPGYVFDLSRDPAAPVEICAHGRTIGLGEIVQVGERLGVRVIRLTKAAAASHG